MKSRLTPEAELDLIEAIRWHDERDQNWVTISCDMSIAALLHWKGILTDTHCSSTNKTSTSASLPFQILYEIGSEEIIIYAIYHSARAQVSTSSRQRPNCERLNRVKR